MDSTRRLIIILVVGIIAVFGIIAIRSWLAEAPPPETADAPQEVRVLVTKRDLPVGTVVQPLADLDWQAMPPEEAQEDYLREEGTSIDSLAGAIVRRTLKSGEPVTQASLTRAGEGSFMSAVLEPGMRAVSISVTPTSGNAGFISPGDRVDLIVTHRVRLAAATNPEGSVISETFIHDVRVIAVDQMLDNPDNQAILAKTVTVEVTPQQAEKIAVAADLGKISFALRSLATERRQIDSEPAVAGEPVSPEEPYTSDTDISTALESSGYSSTIRIIRGDRIENVTLR